MSLDHPDTAVLRAFGVAGASPVRLVGGRGLTWRAGGIVLRPDDGAVVTDWRAEVLATLPHTSAFRTSRPVATDAGAWRSGGWEAWEHLEARADTTRIEDVLDAGRAFHRAVAHLARPPFLDDPASGRSGTASGRSGTASGRSGTASEHSGTAWTRADRMAWGQQPLPASPTLDRLAHAFRPVDLPSQLVHGDLLGNVLFAPGSPPAVIDWPPYWRPAAFGEAIAVVDAVCWHGVSTARVHALGNGAAEWPQLLVRALAFRIATLHLLDAWDAAAAAHHRPVVDALT